MSVCPSKMDFVIYLIHPSKITYMIVCWYEQFFEGTHVGCYFDRLESSILSDV